MDGTADFDWFAFAMGVCAGFVLCFWLMRRKLRPKAPASHVQAIELPPDLRAQVLRYRAEGHVIDAIKLVRSRTGCDLRTAKHLVDGVR